MILPGTPTLITLSSTPRDVEPPLPASWSQPATQAGEAGFSVWVMSPLGQAWHCSTDGS